MLDNETAKEDVRRKSVPRCNFKSQMISNVLAEDLVLYLQDESCVCMPVKMGLTILLER